MSPKPPLQGIISHESQPWGVLVPEELPKGPETLLSPSFPSMLGRRHHPSYH